MKLASPCMTCFMEQGFPPEEFCSAELKDDLYFLTVCSKGHKSVVCLQMEKFQILFELGAMSLLDGYYREAVSSFAAAVERFYEFFIQVVITKHGVNSEQFSKAWKGVANQSERQLGAFSLLYLLEFKKAAPVVNDKDINFRNSAVHKGYLPTSEEVTGYGKRISDYIVGLTMVLTEYDVGWPGKPKLESRTDYMEKVEFQNLANRNKKGADLYGGSIASTMNLPTILPLVQKPSALNTNLFQEGLERLKKTRWLFP